ncbi:hypothetical protein AOY38_08140 [Synechocystis sp. PCC 6803]|nr:hypothetical protein AOY38_08140 [Synechocystis sp. PCC 6803]AVP89639.1 hypothetical protein C7I86_08145 [Synechocystis sp. IPPAS B-1465]QHU99918.1 hypothetical protein BWK47_07055 [Synechocystis sp. CACIAM 05]
MMAIIISYGSLGQTKLPTILTHSLGKAKMGCQDFLGFIPKAKTQIFPGLWRWKSGFKRFLDLANK